ncbi:helix-turn-helix domain-containing protein [Desulfonema magnum]|uniref:HTH domain-containing protein, Cro/C1-type n=1 Tax=Desulfonema magnum TaxID=45655 RepID=A0A975GRB4_9BACT|nr:helix-turn-helix transcriptional regulator [Desulfonema magnum]QTA90735.1 HTH domain-containing protein, Cro/C1-type [Desulfonema magnum]
MNKKSKEKSILILFGEKVRAERLKQHLSQEKLAEKAGLHRTYIGMIERAEKNITLENIKKIADALKVKITNLFEEL